LTVVNERPLLPSDADFNQISSDKEKCRLWQVSGIPLCSTPYTILTDIRTSEFNILHCWFTRFFLLSLKKGLNDFGGSDPDMFKRKITLEKFLTYPDLQDQAVKNTGFPP